MPLISTMTQILIICLTFKKYPPNSPSLLPWGEFYTVANFIFLQVSENSPPS